LVAAHGGRSSAFEHWLLHRAGARQAANAACSLAYDQTGSGSHLWPINRGSHAAHVRCQMRPRRTPARFSDGQGAGRTSGSASVLLLCHTKRCICESPYLLQGGGGARAPLAQDWPLVIAAAAAQVYKAMDSLRRGAPTILRGTPLVSALAARWSLGHLVSMFRPSACLCACASRAVAASARGCLFTLSRCSLARQGGARPPWHASRVSKRAHGSSKSDACAMEMRILFSLAAKQGHNVLFCMPNRTKCILLW
jgi:hypothetical protein